MEFRLAQPGKVFPIPGGVRNAKSLNQKKAFSSSLMNNHHQVFFKRRDLLGFRFFQWLLFSGYSIDNRQFKKDNWQQESTYYIS
jgi:hypothetical protein